MAVVLAPAREHLMHTGQSEEDFQFQTLVSQSSVEALDVSVLDWPARAGGSSGAQRSCKNHCPSPYCKLRSIAQVIDSETRARRGAYPAL
jgi:hypothetical protein